MGEITEFDAKNERRLSDAARRLTEGSAIHGVR
jgi:hypothetical protein